MALIKCPECGKEISDTAKNCIHCGYVLKEGTSNPDLIIIATGSEVELAMNTAAALETEGKNVRVVSMPCTEVFDAQSVEYKESVFRFEPDPSADGEGKGLRRLQQGRQVRHAGLRLLGKTQYRNRVCR